MTKLAPCPICGSAAIEHPAEGLCGAGASCSNYQCILHIYSQDETNKHVGLEQWPKDDEEPETTDEELEEAAKSDNALLADMAKMELHRRGKGPAPWKITGIDRSPTFWKIRNSRG